MADGVPPRPDLARRQDACGGLSIRRAADPNRDERAMLKPFPSTGLGRQALERVLEEARELGNLFGLTRPSHRCTLDEMRELLDRLTAA